MILCVYSFRSKAARSLDNAVTAYSVWKNNNTLWVYLFMWPLCFLLNKILKVQGRSEEGQDGDSISPKYSQFDHPFVTTSHGSLNAPSSSSHMEVRLAIFFCFSMFDLSLV